MPMQAQRGGGDVAATTLQSRLLNEMGGQHQVTAALLPGKTWNPFYRSLRRPRGLSGQYGEPHPH
jgi:hypothetical protein